MMRKNHGANSYVPPRPVFATAACDGQSAVSLDRFSPLVFDWMGRNYHKTGDKAGSAFHDGLSIKGK